MPLPDPKPGLVISYGYLWHHEHHAGRDESAKTRPCVIVVAAENQQNGTTLVRVVPVTHSQPEASLPALELPAAVKRHLDLDDERSWIILDEINEFTWPGFDLRPIPPSRDRFAYGYLPPRLFDQMLTRLRGVWDAQAGKRVPRS